jgi:urea carboxylase
MLKKVLVANRGEIACRVIGTLRKLGIRSVAVYSEADKHALHVREADEAYLIGESAAQGSYLSVDTILAVAISAGVDGIHPGYGFLSENAGFAERCEAAGIAFCGPTPEQLRTFGLKHEARRLARENLVPLLGGSGLLGSADEAVNEAVQLGYPVMLKSTAGGGGIGMRLCPDERSLRAGFESVVNLGIANFGEGGVFIEKAVTRARHIEVQVFGDGLGRVVTLGERDCSLQRRHQKVIEETPAPGLSDEIRTGLADAARRLAEAVNYRSAGTVEFLLDADSGDFYFLEMNTRLQVEHPVTEAVLGVDLVEAMVRLAGGDSGCLNALEREPFGAAIEVRLYAEDPARSFRPDCGLVTAWTVPDGIRCDTWIDAGTEVSAFYDPLLAKIIAHGATRSEALAKLRDGLAKLVLGGLATNLAYLRAIVGGKDFAQGELPTSFLNTFVFEPAQLEVLHGGTQSTVQDYPGRRGYWHVGVPPSGPMDSLSFRLGNRLLGNPESAPGIECTHQGPTLKFFADTYICITGAPNKVYLDDQPVDCWTRIPVRAGQVLKTGVCQESGQRFYFLIAGGLDIPKYLGSASTFILGKFGGYASRELRIGDVLPFGEMYSLPAVESLPVASRPKIDVDWEIGVVSGPQGAPDFFLPDYLEAFFAADWEVHFNSARTGVRLVGPKPGWARKDGGEAGLHPSNLHDNPYALGAVDFTGDMPVILGPDGPSLGGFTCPVTVASAELWKLGQLRPGNRVRFVLWSPEQAVHRIGQLNAWLEAPWSGAFPRKPDGGAYDPVAHSPVLASVPAREGLPSVTYRQSGDSYLLVEFGEMVLDLALRMRVQVLLEKLCSLGLPGLYELTPGIRSLQIHFDPVILPQAELLCKLRAVEEAIPDASKLVLPTRIVHLPLAWDDESTQLAIRRYMSSVNPDAPWCPDNIEFIRRINGLDSREDVKRIVYDASYLVMGLGDVYLGAPVATPLDPRHRLVTTKYNPARTWTPENAVGIGGAYLCIYGMEGPGGYQFVGRTVQVWNRYRQTQDFHGGRPWLLRFFDQIRFYPVSTHELNQMREDFIEGKFKLKVETSEFSLGEYLAFLEENAASIAEFRQVQKEAFTAERERWEAAGISISEVDEEGAVSGTQQGANGVPAGCVGIPAPMPGNVWRLLRTKSGPVKAGETLAVLESMKMEVPVEAVDDGEITEVRIKENQSVKPGDILFVLKK